MILIQEMEKSKCLTIIYKQVFDCWELFHGEEPSKVEEISFEFIFDNEYICPGKKPLNLNTVKFQNISIMT